LLATVGGAAIGAHGLDQIQAGLRGTQSVASQLGGAAAGAVLGEEYAWIGSLAGDIGPGIGGIGRTIKNLPTLIKNITKATGPALKKAISILREEGALKQLLQKLSPEKIKEMLRNKDITDEDLINSGLDPADFDEGAKASKTASKKVKGTGAPSATTYASADEAAKAALKEANPTSISENTEFGGLIYKNPDGTFGYTTPAKGSPTGFDLSTVNPPKGSSVVGDYHTHGDYSVVDANGNAVRTPDPSKDMFGSDNFSTADIAGITSDAKSTPGYTGYLGTPSGDFKRFTPDSAKPPASF
jgi:hypothetical protein